MVSARTVNAVLSVAWVLFTMGCPGSSTPPSPCGEARIDFRSFFAGEAPIDGCLDVVISETYSSPGFCEPTSVGGTAEGVGDLPTIMVGANRGTLFGVAGGTEMFVTLQSRAGPLCSSDEPCMFSRGDCRAEVVMPGHAGDTVEVRLSEPCALRDIDDPSVTRLPMVEWLVMRGPVVARSGSDAGLPDCGF